MRSILILVTALVFQSAAQAQSVDDSAQIQAALNLRNQFVSALQKKDFTSFAHQGFDVAIRTLADQIRNERGDPALADELLANWQGASDRFGILLDSKMTDIGDHSPLFAWVNEFLGKMASKYGTIIYTLPIVKDIQMINYALPVVFRPHGSWQTDASMDGVNPRIEYRKHFIPFVNFVTYYVTLYGCRYVAAHQGQPDLNRVCKPVAERLRFAMGRYVAPIVSDWIFRAAQGSIYIGPAQLKYNTVEDLRQAIRQ